MITNDSQMTGAIGESLVVAELIKKGWVAMNVNAAVRNCKAIDVICIKCDEKHMAAPIFAYTSKSKTRKGFSYRLFT